MRLAVTGGGTGGHIYPALAVAQAWQAENGPDSVLYVGKNGGLEAELVPQANVAFEGVDFIGMPRGLSPLLPFKMLDWLLRLQRAKARARGLLQKFKPDVVFGTGGYVSAPVLMAAASLKIPYVVHEPDAQPGLANRLMGRKATAITTSFSQGAEKLKHSPDQRVIVTGNPIRGAIGHMTKAEGLRALRLDWPETAPVLLVTGGSQGARRINEALTDALPVLLNELNLHVIHQTGRKLYDETLARLSPDIRLHPHYKVEPYYSEMAPLLAAADVALCRAGSLSLSEMYVCGVPTVLIPYPFAAADHQRRNAEASQQSGASIMVEDAALTGEKLIETLRPLLAQDSVRLSEMAASARKLAHPHATQEIVAALKSCMRA